MTPCNYVHTEAGDIGDFVSEECITDPEKQFEYLSSSIQLVVLYNRERLDLLKFGDATVVRESVIEDMQLNPRTPVWIPIDI